MKTPIGSLIDSIPMSCTLCGLPRGDRRCQCWNHEELIDFLIEWVATPFGMRRDEIPTRFRTQKQERIINAWREAGLLREDADTRTRKWSSNKAGWIARRA